MRKKNKRKAPEFKKPFIVLTRKKIAGWLVLIFILSAWMFVLGVLVGRGTAPLELGLPFELRQPVLALGGHMKNTVSLAWDRRLVVSPHIGDMGTPRSMAVFEQVVEDLQQLYGVRARTLLCDAHPDVPTEAARAHCARIARALRRARPAVPRCARRATSGADSGAGRGRR